MDRKVAEELAGALGESPREKRADVVALYCSRYGISRGTCYRWAREGGFDAGRQGIGGARARELTEALEKKFEICAALIHQTASKKYPPKMPTKQAIQIGVQSGYWQPGELTVHQVNKYMLENCPRKPKCGMQDPALPLTADYVNQVGQIDTSNCAQWYLKADGGIGSQDPSIYWTKNKRGKGPAIHRCIYTEYLTGAFYVGYYLGSEATETTLPIFWRATLPKGLTGPDGEWISYESKYPLKGLPEILIADKGSGLKNNYCIDLFENLGIDFRPHQTGNPRAKGVVEKLMMYVECRIETILKFNPVYSIDELNDFVWWELINLNGMEIHSRYGMPRSMAFASWVEKEHLRLPPRNWEEFYRLGHREKDVKISENLTFWFQGRAYSFLADRENFCDPVIMALKNQVVTVMHNPFDAHRVKVRTEDGREYCPAMVENDRFGKASHAIRIKAPNEAPPLAKPIVVQNIEKAQSMDIAAVGGSPVEARSNRDRLENLGFMVKPAAEFVTTDSHGLTQMGIPRLEAKRKLAEMLERRLTLEESERLNQTWSEFVTTDEIERMKDELQPRIDTDCHGLEEAAREIA